MSIVDLVNNVWKCPLCEREAIEPYQRHKLEDELFTPIYDSLYEENYKDRLNIYNDINNQKLKYSERAETELDTVFRENRAKGETSKVSIRSAIAKIRGSEQAISELRNILVKYERIKLEKAREIEEDTRRIREEIEKDLQNAKLFIEQSIQNAQSEIKKSTDKYAKLERKDQSKRDAIQKKILEKSKQSHKQLTEIKEHVKKTREIEEVYAERSGMNERSWFGLGSTERGKVLRKRM